MHHPYRINHLAPPSLVCYTCFARRLVSMFQDLCILNGIKKLTLPQKSGKLEPSAALQSHPKPLAPLQAPPNCQCSLGATTCLPQGTLWPPVVQLPSFEGRSLCASSYAAQANPARQGRLGRQQRKPVHRTTGVSQCLAWDCKRAGGKVLLEASMFV